MSFYFWPDKKERNVSVIISHRNDFPMLGITVKSALEEMVNMPDLGEVIVADNSGENDRVRQSILLNSFIFTTLLN